MFIFRLCLGVAHLNSSCSDDSAYGSIQGGTLVAGSAVATTFPPGATVYLEDLSGPPMPSPKRGRPKQ